MCPLVRTDPRQALSRAEQEEGGREEEEEEEEEEGGEGHSSLRPGAPYLLLLFLFSHVSPVHEVQGCSRMLAFVWMCKEDVGAEPREAYSSFAPLSNHHRRLLAAQCLPHTADLLTNVSKAEIKPSLIKPIKPFAPRRMM